MKPHYSNTNNPIDFPKSKNKMNERIEHCLYQAGLTAQGCWDELDDYARQGIEKFAELIVQECAGYMYKHFPHSRYEINLMRRHMGDKDWNKPIGGVEE